jgi:hypothetical protein
LRRAARTRVPRTVMRITECANVPPSRADARTHRTKSPTNGWVENPNLNLNLNPNSKPEPNLEGDLTMSFRLSRTSLLAVAATAALAFTALTPTNASAWGRGGFHGGFHGFHGFRGVHFGFRGFHGFHRFAHWGFGRYHWGRYHWGFNRYHWGFGHWYPRYGYGWYPRVGCWRSGWCYPHPRPVVYGGGGVIATGVATAPAAAPAMAQTRPNCLVKQYLPNGAVQFADVCTQEQAIAMPNAQPPGQPAQ